MNHAQRVAAIQAMVAIALVGYVAVSTAQTTRTPQRTNQYRQPILRQLGQTVANTAQAARQAPTTLAAVASIACECGPDCKCLDELICKSGACKKSYAVFFTASWCPACHTMYPTINSLREKGYTVFVFDVDQFPKAATGVSATLLPLTVVFDNGVETTRFVGVTRQSEIEKHLKTKSEQSVQPAVPIRSRHIDYQLI